MNGAHFRELISTVSKTTGRTKVNLALDIGVTVETVYSWQRKGVPVRIKPYVISVLRQALQEHLYGGIQRGRISNE